ncbi:MAG: hypothetical protein AB1898_20265 [Acidobacteriota bacterium]
MYRTLHSSLGPPKQRLGESHSDVLVTGTDLFGARFEEKGKDIRQTEQGFSFSLYRPVAEKAILQINLHPDCPETPCWVTAVIVHAKERFDGMQTVDVRLLPLH